MSNNPVVDLVIIVDPHYGDRLEDFALRTPVWIVGSELNHAVCKRIWDRKEHTDHREKGAVTSFKVSDEQNRIGNLLDVFSDIELHHGAREGDRFALPDRFQIEVIGLTLNDEIISNFKRNGFISFTEISDGFRLRK